MPCRVTSNDGNKSKSSVLLFFYVVKRIVSNTSVNCETIPAYLCKFATFSFKRLYNCVTLKFRLAKIYFKLDHELK